MNQQTNDLVRAAAAEEEEEEEEVGEKWTQSTRTAAKVEVRRKRRKRPGDVDISRSTSKMSGFLCPLLL